MALERPAGMAGRRCVVTGATRGIGLAAATALARLGAAVVLVGRDAGRLEGARRTVRDAGGPAGAPPPVTILADLATAAGAAAVVRTLRREGAPIDVLYNNAGAIFPARELTEDGIERTFALNHLAPFRLTQGLMPLLAAAPAPRVATVSSEAHRMAGPQADDWQSARGYQPMRAYGRSKLANILFTSELARRTAGTALTANCFHPGVVRTEFAADARGLLRLAFLLGRPFMRSADAGAATGVWLASEPGLSATSGLYFVDARPRRPSTAALDPALAGALWDTSVALVGATTQ